MPLPVTRFGLRSLFAMAFTARWLLLAAVMIGGVPAYAHPDAMELIARYNALLEAGNEDPKTYYDRSLAWRSLNRLDEATADLKKALELNPGFLLAHFELPRVLATHGRIEEAAKAAELAIGVARSDGPVSEARCWGVLARVELAREGFAPALAALRKASECYPKGELDWSLAEADALRGLGKSDDAIKALKGSYDRTKSLVLRNAWLDALLDANRGAEALPIIEAELAVRPRKSPWLIRRARARLDSGDNSGAQADLRLALEELAQRIVPDHPDVVLLVERAMAWALSGDKTRASQDLALARKNGAFPELLAPARRLLSAKPRPRSESER
jgi:tetratricopeptide (TPR) repeat protein